jgi:hypothetical protein
MKYGVDDRSIGRGRLIDWAVGFAVFVILYVVGSFLLPDSAFRFWGWPFIAGIVVLIARLLRRYRRAR